jgi:phosphoribosyl 1,2-cyclic phosphodiesterase
VRVLFCGVRGSTPSPGPEYVRYGGNTSCVALTWPGEPRPALVVDAGTGLQRLSRRLGNQPFRGTILLGHLHWDHTHGIPFFPAGDNPDSEVTLLMPAQGDPVEVLARAISPPHFPITPPELRGQWRFEAIEEGDHALEKFDVLARDIPHKGGRTFGYRISDGTATIAYLSDHWPIRRGRGPDGFGAYHEAAVQLAQDVDLLIHDAQYTASEFAARREFGHSAVQYAVGLAAEAGSRSLMLFHHDPSRTDDELDEIVRSLADAPVPVRAAAEGMELILGQA